MEFNKLKTKRRQNRKWRIRKGVMGSPEQPRLTVFRSHKNIYAQLVDDLIGRTICEASTRNKGLRDEVSYGGNKQAAARVGKELAARAIAKGVTRVVFDRNGYKFHGRLKALADAAREGGLKF
jgi:large subunit ribosomal protein L18